MKDLKIKVNNEAESKEVQELLFKLGYNDRKNWTQRNPEHESIQAWKDGEFTFSPNHNQVPVRFKEITIPELRAMVEPKMKEYLMPNRNYEYILTDAREGLEPHAKDWIEIPEWANYAYKNDAGICFLKGELGFNHPLLVWQRPTQPEALPFIDDNPQSLNEQYAEIEQVRQAVKVKSGSDSDHMADAMAYGFMGIKHDNVNHPSHYTKGKVECIDAIESATVGKTGIDAVCVANIIKYLWRYEEKNGVEDIKKAEWYFQKLIENNI